MWAGFKEILSKGAERKFSCAPEKAGKDKCAGLSAPAFFGWP
jgi:hypothetical protein